VLSLRGITKDFPGVRALDGVDLSLGQGEVLGLVGENGAGKSTLIKILAGVHPTGTYDGDIHIDGIDHRFGSTADARRAGVAVVHQELSLIPDMTVAENLLLGDEPTRFGVVDSVVALDAARSLLGELGHGVDLETPVRELGVGVQQIIEIAKALGAKARVVVLDEPTAALTDRETRQLFDTVAACKSAGTSFIYISHRLEEIFQICDRIEVLRDGCEVGTVDAPDTDADQIVRMMTGKELAELEIVHDADLGEVVLQLEHLSVNHPEHAHKKVLDDVSLHLRAGEVVTLAGAMGAGRTALLSTLFGLARAPVSGRIVIEGQTVSLKAPRDAIRAGIALVPEDRKGAGLVLGMSVAENITLAALPAYIVDEVAAACAAAKAANDLTVRATDLDVEVATLSGGNQQKVVIGKWLLTEPRILLLDEPTRGVDVGAKAEIYRLIRELVGKGHAVLMASSDLPEVQLLSDRVIVLREGRIAGELSRQEATQEAILQLSVGYRR
jgi:ABC-type sugar transport system ATPase subunit